MRDRRVLAIRACLIGIFLLASVNAGRGATCPATVPEKDAWVTRAIDGLIPAALAYFDDEATEPLYTKTVRRIARDLQSCGLAADPAFYERHREFVDYLSVLKLDTLPDHELGFNIPDKQYFAEAEPFVQIPDYLLEPSFLKLVSRSETLPQAKAALARMNQQRDPANRLVYFSYESRHLGTPDNDLSFRRLLIVVPADPVAGTPDKWVQFGITDPRKRALVRNVSVVTAVTAPDGTYTPYFKDYFRTYRRDGSITLKGRWELGEGDDNCAKCHKSGILPIFPEQGSVAAAELPAVQQVNERFLTYGSPRFGKYLDLEKYGPGLGTGSVESRGLRFGTAYNDSVVGQAMSCANCHRPTGLGYFNWPMDQVLLSSFINGGQMPLNHKLTKFQRDTLYRNLVSEYFGADQKNPGILRAWLEGRLRH